MMMGSPPSRQPETTLVADVGDDTGTVRQLAVQLDAAVPIARRACRHVEAHVQGEARAPVGAEARFFSLELFELPRRKIVVMGLANHRPLSLERRLTVQAILHEIPDGVDPANPSFAVAPAHLVVDHWMIAHGKSHEVTGRGDRLLFVV